MLKIKDILKPCELIDSGYVAKQVVLKLLSYRQAKKCGRSSDHFMTKSHLKMAVVRLRICFLARCMANNPDIAVDFFLENLLSSSKLPYQPILQNCARLKTFIDQVLPGEKFLLFDQYQHWLDSSLLPLFEVKD